MKKLSILFLIFTFISCSHGVERRYKITEFSKPIIDTLKPAKDEQYSTKIIKVKGFVNDTIFISFGENSLKKYFTGKIDTIFNPDYYGGTNAIFIFGPYKATKGEIDLVFSIQ